jgi:hypothetical protein
MIDSSEINAMTARLLEAVAGDEQFCAAVAAAEIERRIEAGELVPIERLYPTEGLEVQPRGKVDRLEKALRGLCTEIADKAATLKKDHGDLVRVAAKFAAALDAETPSPPSAPIPPRPRRRKPAREETPAPPALAPTGDDDDNPQPDGKVEGPARLAPPAPDDHPPCAICGDIIEDEGQALLSWTRAYRGIRETLCFDCFTGLEKAS